MDESVVVDEWIHRYARAWETADEEAVVALFTPDASYRSSVFREPNIGREAIRNYWRRAVGPQRDVVVRTGRPMATEERVVVEWWTTAIEDDDGPITIAGCLLLRFDRNGLCADLWEYWQVEPGLREPPAGWGK